MATIIQKTTIGGSTDLNDNDKIKTMNEESNVTTKQTHKDKGKC